MNVLSKLIQMVALSALILAAAGAANAATYVYVTNAEDGNIGVYTMEGDGTLKPGERVEAGKLVMPMSVSPDKRYLYAAVRTKPFTVVTYAIDRKTGALKQLSKAPLADSMPYIKTDKTGKYLLSASYGGHKVSVNAIGKNGKVSDPLQVIPTATNAHSIIIDKTNRYVYVPHLGTDQIFQFRFDAKTGKLTANTPPIVQMKTGTGPRHIIISGDNKFAYLLSELAGTITALSLDQKTGLLSYVSEASVLPPDSKLRRGVPRVPAGEGETPRDVSNDIWASDLHLTPDGKYLYAAERTTSTIGAFSVDAASGKLTYLASTPTEKQPRGFRIDPKGKFMVVSGELSETISVYAIEAGGALKLLQKYPTGKDSNWVEIVSFD
ncbi:MAG: beta-propeller fold lactonase family protein [Deltaproteobacteria bacterium]|nr:beta-propeller fold lactonase family protein [Deltaproteobacteria bacterium]